MTQADFDVVPDLSDIIKQPGGAWHKARIAHKPHLDIADIRQDFIKLAK